MNFDTALAKFRGASKFMEQYHVVEQRLNAQLLYDRLPATTENQREVVRPWIRNNTNWLQEHRDEYELASKLAKITEDQLYLMSEDFSKWASLFKTSDGIEQAS